MLLPPRRQDSIRLGRAVAAAQEPGCRAATRNRPHHFRGCCTTLVRMLPINNKAVERSLSLLHIRTSSSTKPYHP